MMHFVSFREAKLFQDFIVLDQYFQAIFATVLAVTAAQVPVAPQYPAGVSPAGATDMTP